MKSTFLLSCLALLWLVLSTGCPPPPTPCNTTFCPAPANFQWIDSTDQSLTVSWDNNVSTATEFQVKAIPLNGANPFTDTVAAVSGLMTYTFVGLMPATNYTLELTTICNTCTGETKTLNARTLTGGPLIVIEDDVDMIENCGNSCYDMIKNITVDLDKNCDTINIPKSAITSCKTVVIAWKSNSDTYFWNNGIFPIQSICPSASADRYIYEVIKLTSSASFDYRIRGLVSGANYTVKIKTFPNDACLRAICKTLLNTPNCP
ncbi:MAG: fibronectin type III domain-containing protein [Bacteroidia bacterium]